MDNENKNDISRENKSDNHKKAVIALSIIALIAIAVFIAFSTSQKLKSDKQNNTDNGYSEFVYDRDIKAVYSNPTECRIGDNTYTMLTSFRSEYVIENKGRYSEYGFFFGSKPDFHMMRYDNSNREFWYADILLKYPDITRDKVISIVIPNGKGVKYYGTEGQSVIRVSFGDSTVEITDSNFIEKAVSEYTENRSYSCKIDGVLTGTPIYAKFENSILYYKLGYTSED
ncbi:MAG: hypothetical protein MJ168_11090 [Clostridia bacterium]|nr:hypothetical protein [Clostridia bacterium]